MSLQKIEKLKPFKHFCMSIGELPSSYMESMTYLELLMWLCKYLSETVIPAINNNAQAVEELQSLFIQLQNFVDNYFDNLDVQEEINNKLDEMVEDGTLQNILMNYANVTRVYNTTVEMLDDYENIKNGMKIKTLGYYEINDFGGAEYYISELAPENKYYIPINSLYAILISKNINVKQFGAKGDGLNDDTLPITNALTFFENIYFPIGNYILTSNINISNKKINISSSKNANIKNYGLYFTSCELNICNLNFKNSLNDAIYTESSSGIIKSCTFYDITKVNESFNLYGAVYCKNPVNITVENCNFEKCHGYGALFTRGTGKINIYNNYFNDNDYRGINITRENLEIDYFEGNIFYNYIKDSGKSNNAETGGVACNGMYIPGAIKMNVNYNTIINSRENAIEGYFKQCCYNYIDGTNVEPSTKPTPSVEAIHINCDTNINNETLCIGNIIKNYRKRGIVAIRTSGSNDIKLIIKDNIIEKAIMYEDEEFSIYMLGNPSMSNKIVSNNIVQDKIRMQRADNTCIFSGDINYLDISLFKSTNIISKSPKICADVYFTSVDDLQGFISSNSNLSIVTIENTSKTALRSDYQQYNRIVSPPLTGIKLLVLSLYCRGNFRIQIYKNDTLLTTITIDENDFIDYSNTIPLSDNSNDVYNIRILANSDSYYEISTINYCCY